MRCTFCGKDPELIILVPVRQKDGALVSFACFECSVEAGVYCTRHDRPHTGFVGDDSTACLFCIEEDVQLHIDSAGQTVTTLCENLPSDEFERIREAAEFPSELLGEREVTSIYRFVVTKAHRLQIPVEEVVSRALTRKSADVIL